MALLSVMCSRLRCHLTCTDVSNDDTSWASAPEKESKRLQKGECDQQCTDVLHVCYEARIRIQLGPGDTHQQRQICLIPNTVLQFYLFEVSKFHVAFPKERGYARIGSPRRHTVRAVFLKHQTELP